MLNYSHIDDENFTTEISLETTMELEVIGQNKVIRTSHIILKNGKINQITINQTGKERIIKCQE